MIPFNFTHSQQKLICLFSDSFSENIHLLPSGSKFCFFSVKHGWIRREISCQNKKKDLLENCHIFAYTYTTLHKSFLRVENKKPIEPALINIYPFWCAIMPV